MRRTYRRFGVVPVLCFVAAGLATSADVESSSATPAPASPVAPATTPGAVSDGPGTFYVVRTLDTGLKALPNDDAACNAYFGAIRSATVVERLNANLYGFDSSQASGYLTDQTSTLLGPGYVCDGPGISGSDTIEQYGHLTPPGFLPATVKGFCGLTFPVTQATWTLTNCAMTEQPNGRDVKGGAATSNSVINLLNLPGTPTGSVWTEYLLGTPSQPVTIQSLPSKPSTGDAHFIVGREVNSTSTTSSSCAGGQRSTELHAIRTDQTTGRIVSQPSSLVAGRATVCYAATASPDFTATLTLTLNGFSPALSWAVPGHCRPQALPGVTGSVQQTCGWTLPANVLNGLKGGLVTVNGVVPDSNPSGSTNSAVWTIGLLGGPSSPS